MILLRSLPCRALQHGELGISQLADLRLKFLFFCFRHDLEGMNHGVRLGNDAFQKRFKATRHGSDGSAIEQVLLIKECAPDTFRPLVQKERYIIFGYFVLYLECAHCQARKCNPRARSVLKDKKYLEQ